MTLTLIGPKPGDLAHVAPGSRHEQVLVGHGWRHLAELPGSALRALAPQGLKLPPAAKAPLLAKLVTAALLGGAEVSAAGWVSRGTGSGSPKGPPPKKG